jgi:hypothetical protein
MVYFYFVLAGPTLFALRHPRTDPLLTATEKFMNGCSFSDGFENHAKIHISVEERLFPLLPVSGCFEEENGSG